MMSTWGRFLYRRRFVVLTLSLLMAAASIAMLLTGGNLNDSSSSNGDYEASYGEKLIADQLPGGNELSLLLSSKPRPGSPLEGKTWDDPEFKKAVNDAVAPLRSNSLVAAVRTPAEEDASTAAKNTSTNHKRVLVTVDLKGPLSGALNNYQPLRDAVQSESLDVLGYGSLATQGAYNSYSNTDLEKAEIYSGPAAGILLLIVFGTAIAALLCLGVGGLAVVGGLGGVYTLAHFMDVSSYAINICTLVGLGVAIDYSLLIVSRFREELHKGATVEDAIEITMARAGRAILFSGLTVAAGLSGLLFYKGIFLVSLGIAGTIVVAFAVLYALTFLPALLSIVGHNVDRLSLPVFGRSEVPARNRGFWFWIASRVMRHPVMVLVPTVAILILAGTPFPQMQLVNNDVQQLPVASEPRQSDQIVRTEFPDQGVTTMEVVVNFAHNGPFSPDNVAAAYELSQRLSHLRDVARVDSYVSLLPGVTNAQNYQTLYKGFSSSATNPALDSSMLDVVNNTTGSSLAVIEVVSNLESQSAQADALLADIRAHDTVPGATVEVTGTTAFNVDLVKFMADHTPAAIVFVMVVTFLVLLFLLRSVLLPVKAVLMNLLSLSAALGAVVWCIQQGHLSSILGFQPAPIDPIIPAIVFCLVFGLSLDYEVFLLSRMREAYMRHGHNDRAVAEGLQASGRIVTGAAAIMVAVFVAFALAAQEVFIKAVGLGLAVAVLVDATLVRALVVPALMRLLGETNWWAPMWLKRIIPEPKVE